ncbi:tigger transposable element-derived protein 6 [Drosophila innubila]|uniref:tigger transposable element-derived protein 6 n=1 Tax=Drosophila innubila TaxID=198719 RepID=UPI00148DCE12|nr:tigger transposable element-derived protein 6 [Drosophila innubila]
MGPKRALKCLSLEDKFKLIKDIESGSKNKEVAEKYGIPSSTVSTILKKRELIVTSMESGTSSGSSKRSKKPAFDRIDKAVLDWFTTARGQNMTISNGILKEKAMEFAKRSGDDNFKASTGWLDKWKQRHNVSHQVCKAGFPTDDDIAENYSSHLVETILSEAESNDEGLVEDNICQPSLSDVENAFKTLTVYLQTNNFTSVDHFRALKKLEHLFFLENNKKNNYQTLISDI